jgi:ABC-type glycerol-3-phosphate transport system substrate-binding protein
MIANDRVTRRQFLAGCGSLTAATLLSSCGLLRSDSTGEISFLVRTDIKSAYAAPAAVQKWNKKFDSRLKLDEPAGDPTTKIQAAQAANDLIWDGYAVMVAPWESVEWVRRGLIQPLDGYIEASEIPGADKVVPGIIPSIRESVKFEGEQYAIPGNVGSVALAWLTEPFEAAGLDSQPMTWDEVYEAAKKIKAAKPDMTPFDSAATPLCDLYAMIWGATENPFNEDGLVDITSEASIAALEWMRIMVDEELMPRIHTDSFDNWQKGNTAMITSYDVAGTVAQQTFGKDAAATGINFFREKGDRKAGTPFWVNSCVVLGDAANPQGMTDFLLWWFGPNNKATSKQIAEVAAKPCYQYTYDEFVEGRPEYEWELAGIELVRDSKPFPPGNTQEIEQAQTEPWVQKVLDPDQRLDPREAMERALEDIRAELAKQRR